MATGGRDVKELLLQVDASVELARRNLSTLARQVETDSAKMDASLGRIDGAANRAGVAFSKLTAAAGILGVSLGVDAIVGFGRKMLQFGDDLAAAADKAGVGVERYQILKNALRELEVEGDKADKVLQTLQATLGDVQSGVETGATKALDRLGLTARVLSGEIDDADKLLVALAESSGKAGTQAQFAADLVDIFGKRLGLELVPALGDSGRALQEASARVEEFGGVLSEDMVKSLADANEAIDIFWENVTARAAIGAAAMISSISEVIAWYKALPTGAALVELGTFNLSDLGGGLGAFGARMGARAAGIGSASKGGGKSAIGTAIGAYNEQILNIARRTPPVRQSPRGGGGGGGRRGGGGGGSRRRAGKPELSADQMREAFLDQQEMERGAERMWELLGDPPDIKPLLGDVQALNESMLNIPPLSSILPEGEEERLRNFAANFAQDISAGLANAIVYGEDLGDVLVDSFKRAAAAAIEAGIMDLLMSFAGGDKGGGQNFLASLFNAASGKGGGSGNIFKLPGRAAGGPVQAGQAYWVGEKGPEIVIPRRSGEVIPHHKIGGMGGGQLEVRLSLDNDMLRAEVVRTSSGVVLAAAPGIQAAAVTAAHRPFTRRSLPTGLG